MQSANLVRYFPLIWQRGLAQFRHRYAGTGIGFGWNIIHPLVLIAIYSVVFGIFFKRSFSGLDVPYPLFLCAGLLPWLYFSELLNRGTGAFRENAPYLKRLPVPEYVFIADVAVASTLSMTIGIGMLFVLSLILGASPQWHWLLLPIPMLLLQVTAVGLSMVLAAVNAFFPDVQQVVSTILRLAIWGAPVLFPFAFFEEHGYAFISWMNPATPFILAIRGLFLDVSIPSSEVIIAGIAWTFGSLTAGLLVLRASRSQIRDML